MARSSSGSPAAPPRRSRTFATWPGGCWSWPARPRPAATPRSWPLLRWLRPPPPPAGRRRSRRRRHPLRTRPPPAEPSVAALPVVAVVGRPNVGKSTLFNRIMGSRTAIVEDRARTTRDRLYGEAEWNGRRFVVVDTGGLEAEPGDDIEAKVQEQARLAIAEADVICFVVDTIAGLNPADAEAAEILRSARAPVLVAANKADNNARELEAAEFHALGWERTYPVAAIHGRGVADMLDELVDVLPPETAE